MTNFEKYQKLIQKRAWQYYKQYKGAISFEEIEAQGYLIYCESLKNYDIIKSNFSTHLWWELGNLDSWCKTLVRRKEKNVSIEDMKPIPFFEKELFNIQDLTEYLSGKAIKVVRWILSREWEDENFHKTKPTIKMACEKFHCSYPTMKKTWNEIENFWVNFN